MRIKLSICLILVFIFKLTPDKFDFAFQLIARSGHVVSSDVFFFMEARVNEQLGHLMVSDQRYPWQHHRSHRWVAGH